jgi:hypothetical protein
VVTGTLATTWMLADFNGAPWTPVVPFATEPPSSPEPAQGGQTAWAMAGAQLPETDQDTKLPNNGRLQVWALYAAGAVAEGGGVTGLWSVTKSTQEVNAPWETWQSFGLPSEAAGQPWDLCAAQLSGGLVQIWVNYVEAAGKSLWTKIVDPTSADPAAGQWKSFDLNGAPGYLFSPCGALLEGGRTVLWALGSQEEVPDGPMPVYFTTGTATGGWEDWQLFTVDQDEFPKAWSLQSVRDGVGRSYLWALTTGRRGLVDSIQYSYYPAGASVPQSTEWSAPAALATPAQASVASTARVIGVAALPDGNLELFYVPSEPVQGNTVAVQPNWAKAENITQSTSDPASWGGWQSVTLTTPA